MTVPILHWQARVLASCFHAAGLLLRRQALADPALAAALADPVEKLDLALREDHIPLEKFLSHLIPLAAGIGSLTELTEVALTKTIGRTGVIPRLAWYRGLLADLKIAFSAALPDPHPSLVKDMEGFRRRWDSEGVGILTEVVSWSEPGILVDEATVVLVYPARGGDGGAHPAYNIAHLEAVPADPDPELPEVVRLAWLLSMLNLDLPRYSDPIGFDRLPLVASLATLPLALAAAEAVGFARCDPPTVTRALQSWLAALDPKVDYAPILNQWWEVYGSMRPAWVTAMTTLDQLLRESEPGT